MTSRLGTGKTITFFYSACHHCGKEKADFLETEGTVEGMKLYGDKHFWSIHSLFYKRILKKTILFSSLKILLKNILETRKLETIQE